MKLKPEDWAIIAKADMTRLTKEQIEDVVAKLRPYIPTMYTQEDGSWGPYPSPSYASPNYHFGIVCSFFDDEKNPNAASIKRDCTSYYGFSIWFYGKDGMTLGTVTHELAHIPTTFWRRNHNRKFEEWWLYLTKKAMEVIRCDAPACDTCGARECEDCPVDEFRADSLKRLDDFEKGPLEDGGISEEDKTFFRNLPQEERRRRIRKIIYAPDRSEASKKSWQIRKGNEN